MFATVTTISPGVSAKLEIFQDDVLLTTYTYTAETDITVLSARPAVATNPIEHGPTIDAIATWARLVDVSFPHTKTIDTFRQLVRRTGGLLEVELGQGSAAWVAVTMDRGTDVIAYQPRDETPLTWTRFTRWVAVLVEFIRLAREG